ncbi:MAG: MoaD/ThiS family protein [Gammaproteobacteria bacterium]|nr:MoaD/ThiS family protein [Gammaproteobacteria bacterium]MBU1725671.1 MoaD/ThiS family protein [Gammaproteobacteria bacterium]MBU2003977.1 MoaD/ThiS family protein [Gammaproteobacteria bacterium]
MNITLKLYANLSGLLPARAQRNAAEVEVADNASLNTVIDQFKVPRESAHLVLLNGVFVCHEDRDRPGRLQAGDVLAIWPPVAGG